MKKIILSLVVMTISLASFAVPARRGFHDFQQPDGTTISLQLVGDEFAHWYESADGTVYKQTEDGRFVATTREQINARRKASPKFRSMQARRAKKIGSDPNLAPKGIVILVNFKDSQMKSAHTNAVFNELCNATNCTVNDGYPSAAQYFADQSDGAYRPIFDVFGPVTLSKNTSYYGKNDSDDNDEHATDAVIEACILANDQYDNLNFADYDSDNDGKVDFVYVIYAGKGEADGGASTTIWPHNWSIDEWVTSYSSLADYTKAQTRLDNVYLDNYAMSSELSGNDLGGIGTLCHEFGHVMGLPDFYETNYGNNYKNALTPNDWDIMDGGSYNGDGHCPPNYSPWEKYFFGWHTPINLGNEGQLLTLQANGTTGYQAYQINQSGSLIGATTASECYYIENRQQQGWDEGLPHHGMLIWKVKYNATAWDNNAPNGDDTSGSPLYTIVSASGTKIGTHINRSETAYEYDGPNNPCPGAANVHSKTIANKPLLDIQEANGVITLTYIEEPAVVIDPFELTWMVGGTEFATTMSTNTGKVVLPENDPTPCDDTKVFVGWTRTANYTNATTAPTFVKTGDASEEGDIFYAVFATATDGGPAAVSDVLTLATTGVSGTNYTDWSGKTVTSTAVYAGQSAGSNESIQLRSKNSNSGIITTASGGNVSKVVVEWNSNTSSGRTLDIYGKNTAYSSATDLYDNSARGTKLGSIVCGTSTELTISGDYAFIGMRSNSGAMYLTSVTVTWGSGSGVAYSDYTTACTTTETSVVNVPEYPAAVKAIRNGQVVIIRDGQVFNLLGVQQ